MGMNYIPNPVDTSKIELCAELKTAVEIISKNIHEVWAQNRMNDGWGYGTEHNIKKKLHPCMVAYEALPEIEKDMDRATVTQTIKMLLLLGYKIEKVEEGN